MKTQRQPKGRVVPTQQPRRKPRGRVVPTPGCDLLREGVTYPEGDLPVNLSGGSLCTNGPNSSGLFRVIYSVMLLRNEELGDELSNLRRGLVHDGDVGIGAIGGDSHAVMILEREG